MVEFLIVITVVWVVCVVASGREELDLHMVIQSECNNSRNCIVYLENKSYTLTKKFILNNDTLDTLELIGEGYGTRVTCSKYFAEDNEPIKAIISIFGLKSVSFHQIHFHDCHPAKIIPLKLVTSCPRKIHSNCSTHSTPIPKRKEEYSQGYYTHRNRAREDHEFRNNSDEWSLHLRDTTLDFQVNATIWIKDCYKAHLSFISFNNFSYNAIQFTNTKIVTLSHLFLYSKSLNVSSGYHARGVLYEVKGDNQQFTHFILSLTHSHFEDIATVSPDTEFKVSSNQTLNNIKRHYGGAGAKVLILSAVHADVYIDGTEFKQCSALQGGGLLFIATEEVLGYKLHINNSVFNWNQAMTHMFLNPSGGGLLIKQRTKYGHIHISNTWFTNNCANQGGAVGLDLEEYNQQHTVAFHSEGNVFICNRANLGGAVYIENIYNRNNQCKFKNTNFSKNSANTGGAILGFNSDILMENSNLWKNWGYLGGAIALISSNIRFRMKVSMVHNIAELKGGALYLIAYSMIYVHSYAHVLIKENTAYYKGGGIYISNNYVENNYFSWLSHVQLQKEIFCFITFENQNRLSLTFESNRIINGTDGPCMGSNLFTNTWGNCWNYNKKTPTLLDTDATNLGEVRRSTNCTVALDIVRYAKLDFINESLCYFNTSDEEQVPHCKTNIFDIDSFPWYKEKMRKEAKKSIKKLKNQKRIPPFVYVIYPGFETSIRIGSRDGLDQSILTDTVVLFKPIESNKQYDIKFEFGDILTDRIVSSSSSRVNFSITKSENGWVHGELCLKSQLSLRVITYCIPVILAKCMPGFKIGDGNKCHFTGDEYIKGVTGTRVTVHRNVLMVVDQETKTNEEPEDVFQYVHCTWFQCKCDSTGTTDECTFNALKPQDQCRAWLKGKYCSESNEVNQTLVPTYSFHHLITNSYSFKCRAPWVMMGLYFVLCLLILAFIIILKIDIFADYTRSITFYSGILLTLSLSCGGSGDELFQKLITIPILTLNLKLTHMYPFCIFTTNVIKRASWELYAPLIFPVYMGIIYLCIHYLVNSRTFKSKRFNDKDILTHFWTILILLYTNLCSGALLVFKCSVDSNNVSRWILNGNIICYVKEHMHLSIAAILILFLLTVIPLLFMASSCAELKGKKYLVSLYEKRYSPRYKHWEPIKMLLRFVIALLLIIPEGFVNFNFPCIIVSVICLILMILTSLLKPSLNSYANHFESFCLLVLGFTGIRVSSHYKETYLNILLIIPYVIYLGIIGPKLLVSCVEKTKQMLRKNKRNK